MKQICLKLVLFVLSVFTFLSVSAYDFEADGLYFTITSLKDLTVSVDGAVNKDTDKVVIPQTVVYKNKTLTITSVGSEAFMGYKNLQSVSFPNTVLSIGESAFEEDKLLADVVLPDSLLEIGSNAFAVCTSLKTIRIPEKVVDLNYKVFGGCSGLISVTLNDSLRSIGSESFYGTSIKELKLPLSLSNIDTEAFAYSKIREINFPKSLRSIGNGAFMNSELLHIELPMSLTSIGEQAFKNTKVRQIDVGVENIPKSCFEDCDSLKYIRWTGEIKSIGRDAFGGCNSLESFTIPSSVTEISTSILWGCPNISKLTIGKGLDALPLYEHTKESFGFESYIYESLTSYYEYSPAPYYKGYKTTCLKGLKTVIIEDASSPFAIRGLCVSHDLPKVIPSFADLDLNYYYVGRPLIDIHSWKYNGRVYSVEGSESRGHIKKLEIAGTCTENPYFYQDVDTLILGAKIKSFDVDCLHLDSLKVIEIKSTTPPVMLNGTHIPNKVYTDVTLYVPKGCKDAYSNDPGWGSFWDIRESEDDCDTKVSNVTDNLKDIAITTQDGSIIVSNAPHNTLVNVYNLQGALVAKSQRSVISGLSKGAYLVNVGGKTFKVVL